jgi:hypothetical protein
MSKIAEHYVGTRHGPEKLLEWVAGAQHRMYDFFDERKQLELAKQIAAVEDKGARDLLLSVLQSASGLRDQLTEAKREFDTLHKVLVKIAAQDSDNPASLS